MCCDTHSNEESNGRSYAANSAYYARQAAIDTVRQQREQAARDDRNARRRAAYAARKAASQAAVLEAEAILNGAADATRMTYTSQKLVALA